MTARQANSTSTSRELLVTLTGADNTYLQARLPVRGLVYVTEYDPDGSIISARFREARGDGFAAPVEVRKPRFTYGEQELAVEPTTAAEHYQLAAHYATLATKIHLAQIDPEHHQAPPAAAGDAPNLAPGELFDRYMRLAELHIGLATGRTTGATFVATRPTMGQRAGASVEHGAWERELREPVQTTVTSNA